MELPDISCSEEGKPYFPKHPEIHFNLSHTRGAVLVALSDRQVGVDMEWDRPLSCRLQKLLQVEEAELLHAWVRWEACAKCVGQGVLPFLRQGMLPSEIVYQEIEIFPDYCAGVASWGEEEEISVHYVEPEVYLRQVYEELQAGKA